ncbi:helix-turn-helix domain-containing protein [Candidatus Enterococcus mansonii]|uniref:PucR C-terminal helix-turn-helix domain-containing protein n=1 Tax=Candidatus Enterococcus mansonii TaxID=1834181 RepID=A0A242CJF0_9ENTE|nr:helix-turn-helix domain-containing protein [Enterococcus sp. 4G2_DIV0659]OTO10248.1 hypothetical protein A5880_000932 [Enterococcus sp. 4G2_DIV0659]
MTIEELVELYPSGKIKKHKPTTTNDLSLLVGDQYFIIPKELLKASEIRLLKKLFPSKLRTVDSAKHPWYGYLFEQIIVERKGTFRILQFKLKKTKDFLQVEWENSIKDIFEHQVDFFFTTDNQGIIVEKYAPGYYTNDELQSIFLTLDADFDTSTTVFIGNFYTNHPSFFEVFQEEQQIFAEESAILKGKNTFSLTDVALHYFTKKAMEQSQIVQSFRNQLTLTSELQQIIFSLWRNQGNISSAAKDLYMHRNTLHYRVEKFYEQTGLSLKKMDDLVFCYLLITK